MSCFILEHKPQALENTGTVSVLGEKMMIHFLLL